MDRQFILGFIFLMLLLDFRNQGFAQSIDNLQKVKITTPYDQVSDLVRYLYDSGTYERARNQQDYEFATFTYNSDGNQVEGFLCRPVKFRLQKIPVILYNRGGTGNYGKLTEADFPNFYYLAKQGFYVVASNYRYVGSRGKDDQLGGDDVNDVVNLYKLLPRLEGVDTSNVFLMGVSRGGLMTYKTLSRVDVNAAAVIGGVANYFLLAADRPVFIEGWDDLSPNENYRGLKNILPDFERKKTSYLEERSPVLWPDKINSPLLILHSRQDGFVTSGHALEMASALHKAGKSYQLKIYDEKSHSLPYQYFDSYDEIVDWFKKFIK